MSCETYCPLDTDSDDIVVCISMINNQETRFYFMVIQYSKINSTVKHRFIICNEYNIETKTRKTDKIIEQLILKIEIEVYNI